MKTANEWFSEYGESHQNKTNKLIHWICVPSIFFSIVGLFAAIPHQFLDDLFPPAYAPFINIATVLLAVAMIFYLLMSFSIFLGMILISAISIYGNALIETSSLSLVWVSLTIFVLAWVGQFIGHKIEGKKPSFFKDLQFLLVGPAWLLHFIYKKFGMNFN